MSWIRQTIDFYRGMNRTKDQPAANMAASSDSKKDSKHDSYMGNESHSAADLEYRLWLGEFEQSIKNQITSSLTPEQQGSRLLRLTKARALRRLLDKPNTNRESAA